MLEKEEKLNELKDVPQRLREHDEEQRLLFEADLKKLECSRSDSMKDLVTETQNEKDRLTKAIQFYQANLRTVTQNRDDLKQQYEYLKDQITKMTNTADHL